MKHLFLITIAVVQIGCKADDLEFKKMRKAHCDLISETQKVAAERFDKSIQVLGQIDLSVPAEGRSDESVCDQAAIELELAMKATDRIQASASTIAKMRPKGMMFSESGIVLNNTSKMIKEFVPKVRDCKDPGEIKSLIPWVQSAVKVELNGELKTCRLAVGQK